MKLALGMLLCIVTGCGALKGAAGPSGAAGPEGKAGADGAAGAAGANGAAVSIATLLTCTHTLNPAGASFWDGVMVTYQQARLSNGEVLVFARASGKADFNETAWAVYKPDDAGAKDGGVTVGVGDADYLDLKVAFADEGGQTLLIGMMGANQAGSDTEVCTKK